MNLNKKKLTLINDRFFGFFFAPAKKQMEATRVILAQLSNFPSPF